MVNWEPGYYPAKIRLTKEVTQADGLEMMGGSADDRGGNMTETGATDAPEPQVVQCGHW